jgi:hypothetical protein
MKIKCHHHEEIRAEEETPIHEMIQRPHQADGTVFQEPRASEATIKIHLLIEATTIRRKIATIIDIDLRETEIRIEAEIDHPELEITTITPLLLTGRILSLSIRDR